MTSHIKVPAKHFVQTLTANIDNENLDDAAFREFVRNTLPIVEGGQKPSADIRVATHVGDVSVLPRTEGKK